MRDRVGNGEGERRRGGGPPGPRPHRPVTIGAGVGRLGPAPGIISMPGPRLRADVAAKTDS